MRYLSLFSGIEAASVAWQPLGWTCVAVAEIEPFPAAVLAHHYPDVPNLGDVTAITDEQIAALGPIDVVIGGSPCQDLSVAGKRAGLAGERSGLFHHQLRIFHAARHLCGARFIVWENVPGAFSTHGGRDFAVVVGAMAGCELPVPEDGWGTEGVALGEHGLVEWTVLDAQWFGVAQRRRRVFAVLDVGDWASRPPILLERDSLRGDSAPSREAGQRVANALTERADRGGTNSEGQRLIPVPHADLSPALKARDSKGPSSDGDGDGAILVPMVAPTLQAGGNRTGGDRPPGTTVDTADSLVVTHSLRGEGFDASEDGTGRGTPIVPVASPYAIQAGALRTNPNSGPDGVGVQESIAYTLEARAEVQAVAFSCKDHGADAGDIAPTLRSMGHDGSHANGGGQVAVAFMADDYKDGSYEEAETSRPLTTSADRTRAAPVVTTLAIRGRGDSHDLEMRTDGTANALLTPNGGRAGIGVGAIHCGMQVRRLTPVECCRLQGFPDDYLSQVPWRGKPHPPDGPMYKALGNSMAVPVMRWIGRQIAAAARCNEAAA